MEKTNSLIIDCPLCHEHNLHVVGKDPNVMYQCISCGYMTTSNFKINGKEDNSSYISMDDNMKSWTKDKDDKFWIPIILTLPTALIYPVNESEKMRWALAKLIDIDKDNIKKYPVEGKENEFYNQMYDVDNKITYEFFYEALSEVINSNKEKNEKI